MRAGQPGLDQPLAYPGREFPGTGDYDRRPRFADGVQPASSTHRRTPGGAGPFNQHHLHVEPRREVPCASERQPSGAHHHQRQANVQHQRARQRTAGPADLD